ncbi:unnamed protein product [Toxocara canis]|uniref:Na_H_Exchanger domain-containing protein n=1 Tax=Toxocara canis TaxID=6265 RepID=A0A183VAS5_TOXCA|nr:unnamed protein product [Toxocara canis]
MEGSAYAPTWNHMDALNAISNWMEAWLPAALVEDESMKLQLPKSSGAILRLGILSPILEATAIAIAAYFFFSMGVRAAIVFGMVLAATSPAVTIPTMLRLSKKGYGVSGGVPTMLLAAAAIDNMICITLFNVFLRLISSKSTFLAEIGIIIAQIFIGLKLGLTNGILLRYFPSIKQAHFHFTRGAMLFALSLAFIFGGQAAGWDSGGVIATIIVSIVASLKWKTDNPDMTTKEADTFKLMWDLGGMQVLFVLIGYEFDFGTLDYGLVLRGLLIIAIGVLIRIISVYILSFGSGFKKLEQIFISLSFLPKATVQAALVPQLVDAYTGTRYAPQASIILTTCVFAILITAPLGQLILQLLGPKTLKRKNTNEVFGVNNVEQAKQFDKLERPSNIVLESVDI